MPLCRSDRNSLELAGFALAEGVARASAGLTIEPTLVVWEEGDTRCIPVQSELTAKTHASVLLDTLSHSLAAAALLLEKRRRTQRFLHILAWADGSWRFDILMRFIPGAPLRVQPERIRGVSPRSERGMALDAVYSGVGGHPRGLEAWVRAEVDL